MSTLFCSAQLKYILKLIRLDLTLQQIVYSVPNEVKVVEGNNLK